MATPIAIEDSSLRSSRENARDGANRTGADSDASRVAPLSFEQERLWFLDQLEPGLPLYNIPRAFHLRGRLDPSLLDCALNEIVERHESLRTTFRLVEDVPQQIVAPALQLHTAIRDLRDHPEAERSAEADRQLSAEAAAPFDLERDPLVRMLLIQLGANDYRLLITMHHIVSEGGWSMNVFLDELGRIYNALARSESSPLRPLPMQYADYARWQRDRVKGEVLERELQYWSSRLAGASAVLHLPADRPRPPQQQHGGAHARLRLSPQLSERLAALSRASGVTTALTLLGAWAVVLRRYTERDDILLWMPVAGRTHLQTEGLIGFFVNTLPLRVDAAGDPSFRELLDRVRELSLGALEHQELPLARIVELLRAERVPGRTPPLQAMFAPQPVAGNPLMLDGVTVEVVSVHSGTTTSDLTLYSWEQHDGIQLVLEYCTDLFDADRIHRMLDHYRSVLEGAATDASFKLSELPLLTTEERFRLLVEWSHAGHESSAIPWLAGRSPVYILDAHMHPVPVGVPGELFVGRDAAATDPGADASRADVERPVHRLVPDPFSGVSGAMLESTGVRAWWSPDGKLSIIGPEAERASPVAQSSPSATVDRPPTALEIQLSGIWQEILGMEPTGVRENFFEMGGHSLMAARLFSLIEARLGQRLPLATLLRAPTIAQLAAVLEQERAKRASASSSHVRPAKEGWSSLVPISESGSRPPLICVHGSGGNVVGYRSLAKHLGPEQPLYGLQAKGLDGVTPPVTDLVEMAANYVAEVRAAWPDGPYALCGLSFGGTVAFEMARLLQLQGQSVMLLALFDSCPAHTDWMTAGSNGYGRLVRLSEMIGCHLRNMRSLPPHQLMRYVRAQLRTQRHLIRGILWRRRYRLHHRLRDSERTLPSALQSVERACEMAFREYTPRPYTGRVTLFRAAIRSAGEGDDPLFGWGRLAAAGVDVCDVPGSHLDMLNEPHVEELAGKLSACLSAAAWTRTASSECPDRSARVASGSS